MNSRYDTALGNEGSNGSGMDSDAPRILSLAMVSPRDLLESILADLIDERCERGLPPSIVTLDVSDKHLMQANPVMVRSVFTILLANALESSARPSGAHEFPAVREVVVTSVGYPDAIEIEVADSGPSAIAPNYFLKPAGPLALADVHGLESRVWQLVVQLGGTLTAINCPEGGTAFTLRLPHRLRQRMAA